MPFLRSYLKTLTGSRMMTLIRLQHGSGTSEYRMRHGLILYSINFCAIGLHGRQVKTGLDSAPDPDFARRRNLPRLVR